MKVRKNFKFFLLTCLLCSNVSVGIFAKPPKDWPEALAQNIKLGIITDNVSQVQKVFDVFQQDWKNSQTYEEADVLK